MSKIARAPKAPPAEGPNDPRYGDPRDLEEELRRTFQVCHECRMCVGYCGSFPILFNRVDRDIESGRAEGAELLDDKDFAAVSDACWQCKLCYVKCPYTKDDGASELLDFPRLMAREKAARAKREGITLVDRVLGEPDLVGKLGGGPFAGLTNLVHASRLVRRVQEKVAGISSEFPLPTMARTRFSEWMKDHRKVDRAGEAGTVLLYSTCYGEFNAPAVPESAVRVLEHNGFRVILPGEAPESDTPAEVAPCCGMPNLDGGDVDAATDKIRRNVAMLYPAVQAGVHVVVPNPTCGYTMKHEWTKYVDTPEAHAVAAATMDLMEFLLKLGKEKRLSLEFKKSLGNVAYHAACHLRAQKIGFPGARILGKVPDTEVHVVEECSAVDGTWGMKAEHYSVGKKYAQKLVRGVRDVEPDLVVTDCTLSALRVDHETGGPARVVHPVQALHEAYGLGDADGTKGIVPESTKARASS